MNILCLASCVNPPWGQVEGTIQIWFWVKDGMSDKREVEGLGIFRGEEEEKGKEKEESDKNGWR